MEQRIQYTTTSDGLSIAWGEVGQGPALLLCGPIPFTHVQEQVAVVESWYGAAARSFRVITFDARGTGMSERDIAGVSAETLLVDAEAVIDAAKLDRFILLTDPGSILALSTCLRLAIAHPERVTHVVLESPFPNLREIADTSMAKAGFALAELDWAAFLQTLFRVLLADAASSEMVETFVAGAGGWVDQPVGIQYVRASADVDVSDLLSQVRQPTLVLRNDPYFVPARCCQRVAAKIPGAQFLQYSDPTFVQQVELINAFVAQSSPPPAREAPAASPLRAVLFTDLVGHTEMMSRLGDAKGRDVLREHERITREVLKSHAGTEVKTMGDGFLASFGSVTKAVECAVALQRVFAEREGEPLAVRVGLNAGEPIEEDGDLFGATVILASRIAAKAEGGEILVADTVRGLCSGKGFLFADRGEFVAKGIEEPVRISEVSWRDG
jgi:class 3 adenylate cyclase/pimeloyl-ACP methyl ester carboxylesterase